MNKLKRTAPATNSKSTALEDLLQHCAFQLDCALERLNNATCTEAQDLAQQEYNSALHMMGVIAKLKTENADMGEIIKREKLFSDALDLACDYVQVLEQGVPGDGANWRNHWLTQLEQEHAAQETQPPPQLKDEGDTKPYTCDTCGYFDPMNTSYCEDHDQVHCSAHDCINTKEVI